MKKFSIVLSLILCFGIAALAQEMPLKILEKPKPERPKDYGTLDVQGTIILRVQFLDFGEVGEITPVKTLPADLTEKAIAAARKIKFEPAKKDGKSVTVVKQIEYSYSWNGGWLSSADTTSVVPSPTVESGKAEAIIAKAVQNLGGDRYLQVRSQVGRGKFSAIKENVIVSFQSFTDVIVFPDKERTEFKGSGSRTVQTNTGGTGWVFDGDQDIIKIQNATQVANFKQGGKRQAGLGKRNDVVRLTYKDGFIVEFEFAVEDGVPQKAVYKQTNSEGEDVKEEDRYAQFIDVNGVKAAFIVDRFSNGKPSSRINYESIEFNRSIPDSVFAKPANPKDAKKDIRF